MNEIILTEKNELSFYEGFLECLYLLSDSEKQEKAWLKGDYSDFTDFTEVYICFSDSCEIILTWPELSKKQLQFLKTLHSMVERYSQHASERKKTDEEICKDPEWHKIRKFAKDVYDKVSNVKLIPKTT